MATNLPKKLKKHFIFRILTTFDMTQLRYLDLVCFVFALNLIDDDARAKQMNSN